MASTLGLLYDESILISVMFIVITKCGSSLTKKKMAQYLIVNTSVVGEVDRLITNL